MTALSVSLHRDADSLVAARSVAATLPPSAADATHLPWKVRERLRRPYLSLTADVVARPNRGPAPPPAWGPILHQVVELVRTPVAPPSWWPPTALFCGGVETRTDSDGNPRDGDGQRGAQGAPGIYVQLSLAGWGHVQVLGEASQRVMAGRVVFATNSSEHRCYLPEESSGWTFVWLDIHHPYLRDRLAKQMALTGSVLDLPPNGALTAGLLRLVRGAIKKDFRDRFEAEIALFEFVLTFERWAQQSAKSISDGQTLMDEVRSYTLASLPRAIEVHTLAAEFGMSRSHFSHYFRERTGLTPAHFSTEVRVEQATRMLRETRDPLKAIADACGFASANHLCKVFRRLRHLSPASFRQERR
jgi:AraC-like DNA-binding protein